MSALGPGWQTDCCDGMGVDWAPLMLILRAISHKNEQTRGHGQVSSRSIAYVWRSSGKTVVLPGLGEAVLLLAGEQWLHILRGSQAATKPRSVKKVRVTVHSYTTSSLSNRLSVDTASEAPSLQCLVALWAIMGRYHLHSITLKTHALGLKR